MYLLDLTQTLVCFMAGRIRKEHSWGDNGKRIKVVPRNIFVLLIDGTAEFCVDGHHYSVKQGDILLIPCGVAYTATTETSCEFFFVEFYGELTPCAEPPRYRYERKAFSFLMREIQSQSICLPEFYSLGARYAEYFARVSNCLAHATETTHAAQFLLNIEFLRILIFLSELLETEIGTEQLPAVLTKIIVYIRKNLTSPLMVSDIAQALSLSPSYIARLFKRYYGLTPTAYIISEKMHYARELMHNSDMNVSEIAAYLGYCDIFYFSRLYKKTFGQSPTKDILDR